jgi:phenylalanyl-tRNA synthetase, alpha subunit
MQEKISIIVASALEQINNTSNVKQLQDLRVEYLGKKGELTLLLRALGTLSPEERPKVGGWVNEAKEKISGLLDEKQVELKKSELEEKLSIETLDISLPGTPGAMGKIHPIIQTLRDIEDIFFGLGFSLANGPEMELEEYNFDRLNFLKDHPARDMQDTFFIEGPVLLRTHTSPVQARTLSSLTPDTPVRIIAPGKVFRRDYDATHSPMFHQVEGLVVDKGITFGDLKGTLEAFCKTIFGDDTQVRFRPSFFPFTEPSAEVDISCVMCHGNGCRVCSHTGWLEILGSGMVHPNVLKSNGYDPKEMTGFAFGMGVERIAMLRMKINDIRLFYENDIRFLQQF